jgi:hypothetical protein
MKQERTTEREFQVGTDNVGSRKNRSRMKALVKIFHRMNVDQNENTAYIFIPLNRFLRSLLFTRSSPLVAVNTINEYKNIIFEIPIYKFESQSHC